MRRAGSPPRDIGTVAHGSRLTVGDGIASETIWDFAQKPLIGAGPASPMRGRGGRMTASNRLPRIAILAHSTNPRGGVVHALELADSLTRLGYEAVVHAPDASGKGFFRAPLSPAVTVMASPATKNVAEMVQSAHRRLYQAFRAAGQPAIRCVSCAGFDFGQCAGDAEAARLDRALCAHRPPYRQFSRSPPQRMANPFDRRGR